MNGYRRIARGEVPAWLRDTCEKAARESAALLGLPGPALRWCWEIPGQGGWRFAWVEAGAHEINLNISRLRDARTARAMVFHEARHLWQVRNSRFLGRREGEKDAIEWSYKQTGIMVENLVAEWEI